MVKQSATSHFRFACLLGCAFSVLPTRAADIFGHAADLSLLQEHVQGVVSRPVRLLGNTIADKIDGRSHVASSEITVDGYPRTIEKQTAYELTLGPSPKFCSDGMIWEGSAGHPAECQVKCDVEVQCAYFAYFRSERCRISKSCDSLEISDNDEVMVFKKKEVQDSSATQRWWPRADAQTPKDAQSEDGADRGEIQLSITRDSLSRINSELDQEGEVLKRPSPFDGNIILEPPLSSKFNDAVQDFFETEDVQDYLFGKAVHENSTSDVAPSPLERSDVLSPRIRQVGTSDVHFLHKFDSKTVQDADHQVNTSVDASSSGKTPHDDSGQHSTNEAELRHMSIGKHRRHAESNSRDRVMDTATPMAQTRRPRRMHYFAYLFVPLFLIALLAIVIARQPGFSIQDLLHSHGILDAKTKPICWWPQQHDQEYPRKLAKAPAMFAIPEEDESELDNDGKVPGPPS